MQVPAGTWGNLYNRYLPVYLAKNRRLLLLVMPAPSPVTGHVFWPPVTCVVGPGLPGPGVVIIFNRAPRGAGNGDGAAKENCH